MPKYKHLEILVNSCKDLKNQSLNKDEHVLISFSALSFPSCSN